MADVMTFVAQRSSMTLLTGFSKAPEATNLALGLTWPKLQICCRLILGEVPIATETGYALFCKFTTLSVHDAKTAYAWAVLRGACLWR
jgi:hypothetical protein